MGTGRSVNEELVELGDLDELVRHIDRLCRATDWDGLLDLRNRCRTALERGRQLWPAASHAEYRLALEAPGPIAARMVVPGAGHLSLGPLTEVVASTHRWEELADHLPDGPTRAVTAHERVVRGEDLTGDDRIDRHVIDLPLALQPWEPRYPVAEYLAHEAHFPPPPLPDRHPVVLPAPSLAVERIEDPETIHALAELTRAWTAESNGRSEVVAVRGDARCAIAALGPPRARLAELSGAEALAWMAWAAASGGAHGRRRGMARGRFDAWWALASMAGLVEDWPLPPDELGAAAAELRWFAWDAWEPETGWRFHLAVEDPLEDLAWAVAATDAA
ncbi:DUF6183 family protein [Rhabdothermincola sp.]|uniref:DUF6183 family protein n=1 Tax=Rhabdothermincola sp. TaxID=2820405 RepID=UPI002FE2C9EA